MILANETGTRKIQITKADQELVHYPGYQLQVGFETENVKGDLNNWIWVSLPDLERFLEELDRLDQTRKGAAILESMSPREFRLTFRGDDPSGHLTVALQLKKKIADQYSFELAIEFKPDPTALAQFRAAFKSMTR